MGSTRSLFHLEYSEGIDRIGKKKKIQSKKKKIKKIKKKKVYKEQNVPELSCIGITNQRETIVAWDKETKKPLFDAILWSDLRSMEQCKQIEKKQPKVKKIKLNKIKK